MYKQKGGFSLQSYVSKWGNNLGIRIPRSIAQQIGLIEGTPVELQMEKDGLMIRPKKYDLETLLAKITPENLHKEVETGEPVGNETW